MTELNKMLEIVFNAISKQVFPKTRILIDFQRIHAWDTTQIGIQEFSDYKKIYLNGTNSLTLDHFSKLTEEFYLYYDYGVAIPDFYDPEEFKKLFRPSSELAYPEITKFNKLDLCK